MILPKIYFFLLLIIFLSLNGCSKDRAYEISGNSFGTIYYIYFEKEIDLPISKIQSGIDHIINIVNSSASNYDNNSEINLFNNSKDDSFKKISPNLYKIIEISKIAGDITDGYFDITVGDIKISKGFYIDKKNIEIKDNRDFNYTNIILSDGNLIRKTNSDIYIDLSGVAKGYAVDLIYDYLISAGLSNFIINIGGEIKAYSEYDDPTTIGIDDPTKRHQYIEEILLNNQAIATSGTHLDTVDYKGQEISHITNPKNLKNISNLNLLVSVIHKECAIADALATGLIAMNYKDIIEFSNEKKIASMLTIFSNDIIEKRYSAEFMKFLKN